MDNQRNMVLAIVLSALILFGWTAIADRFFPTANPGPTRVVDAKSQPLPTPSTRSAPVIRDTAQAISSTERVAIRNGRVQGSINLTGARIDDLVLTGYRQTIAKNAPPVRLLAPAGTTHAYYAGFGWVGDNVQLPNASTVWTADRTELTPTSPVTLSWTNAAGLRFGLRFSIDPNFLVTVEQLVANGSGALVALRPFGLVARDGISSDPDTWNVHVGPIGVFGNKVNYDVDWKDVDAAPQRFQTNGGWLGFGDKYWLTALAPAGSAPLDAGFRAESKTYQADYAGQPVIVAPGQVASTTTRLFAGAKEVALLDGYEARLGIPLFGKAIDWGWYEVIEKPIFYYLHWLFQLVGNFGVAIILLTLTVRLLLFPIAQKQFASMAAMRVVQPKMKALQERYKDDKPRLQQEIMALYKAEKVNPLAGCLPLLLQIPIFFALYKVLILSTEMRHQPFFLWIKDLSAPDPLTPVNLFGLLNFTPPHIIAIGVLPIILGITQYLQFKLNPQPTDEVQAQVFKILPWVFMFMMASFASGLIVYWITSNILTIAQQAWLYSKHPGLREPVKA